MAASRRRGSIPLPGLHFTCPHCGSGRTRLAELLDETDVLCADRWECGPCGGVWWQLHAVPEPEA